MPKEKHDNHRRGSRPPRWNSGRIISRPRYYPPFDGIMVASFYDPAKHQTIFHARRGDWVAATMVPDSLMVRVDSRENLIKRRLARRFANGRKALCPFPWFEWERDMEEARKRWTGDR